MVVKCKIGGFSSQLNGPRAIDMWPDNAAAYWQIGRDYKQFGDSDSARYRYQASLQLKPDYKDARKSLNMLEKKK